MTVTIPRWLLVLVAALVGAAIAVGVTLYVTDDNTPEDDSETIPAESVTSPEELAQIEASANEWDALFDGITARARDCEQREDVGIESYQECADREVGGVMDAADAELAREWANLEPGVAAECAEALDLVARQIVNQRFVVAEDALPPCRNSVSQ